MTRITYYISYKGIYSDFNVQMLKYNDLFFYSLQAKHFDFRKFSTSFNVFQGIFTAYDYQL